MLYSKKRGFYEVKVKKHIQMAMSTLKTHANNTKCEESKLEGRRYKLKDIREKIGDRR